MSIVYGHQNGAQSSPKDAPPAQQQAYAPAPPQVGVPPQIPHQYVQTPPNVYQGQQLMPLPTSPVPQPQTVQQNQNYGTAQGYSIQPSYQMPQNPVQPNMPPPLPQAQLQQGYQMPAAQQPMQVGNQGAMEMQSMPQQAMMPQEAPVNLQAPPANIHTVRNQQVHPQTVGNPAAPATFVAGRKLRSQQQVLQQQQVPQQVLQQQQVPQQVLQQQQVPQQQVQQQQVQQQQVQQQQVQQQAAQQEAPPSPFSEPAPLVGNNQSASADTVAGPEDANQSSQEGAPGTLGGNAENQSEEQPQNSGVPISHYGQIDGIGDRANNWMQAPLGSREEVEMPRPVFGPMYGQQMAQRDPKDGKEKVIWDPYTRRGAIDSPIGVAQHPTYGIGRIHKRNIHKAYQNRDARRVSGALPFGARYTNPQQIPTSDTLRGYIGQ